MLIRRRGPHSGSFGGPVHPVLCERPRRENRKCGAGGAAAYCTLARVCVSAGGWERALGILLASQRAGQKAGAGAPGSAVALPRTRTRTRTRAHARVHTPSLLVAAASISEPRPACGAGTGPGAGSGAESSRGCCSGAELRAECAPGTVSCPGPDAAVRPGSRGAGRELGSLLAGSAACAVSDWAGASGQRVGV